MSYPANSLGVVQTMVDVAKVYFGAWLVGAAVDEALAGATSEQYESPYYPVPPPAPEPPADPALEKLLPELEGLPQEVRELKAKVDALPIRHDTVPAPELPRAQPVQRGSVEELNAALEAYNEAARRLGLGVLAGNIDKRVARGELEEVEDAIAGVLDAAERLMWLASSLVSKAESLVWHREDLEDLVTSPIVERKLPMLLALAAEIEGCLGDGTDCD